MSTLNPSGLCRWAVNRGGLETVGAALQPWLSRSRSFGVILRRQILPPSYHRLPKWRPLYVRKTIIMQQARDAVV